MKIKETKILWSGIASIAGIGLFLICIYELKSVPLLFWSGISISALLFVFSKKLQE